MKRNYSSGFSLIELMLAMLIGLIILGGVMQVYVSTRDTQRSSEDQLAMLGDARFAMETIAYDLRHTNIWGRNNMGQLVACQKGGADALECYDGYKMPLAESDCASEEYINIARPLYAENDTTTYGSTCASQSHKTGTDVLSVRYADTLKLGSSVLSKNTAYIRSCMNGSMLFIGPDVPDLPESAIPGWKNNNLCSNHLLISRLYYVSDYTDKSGDGLPSLRRSDLVAGINGPAMVSDVLLRGVESFQLEFGVDTVIDGVSLAASGESKLDSQVDGYVTASDIDITNGVDALEWNNGTVLAVRVWMLMRSEREDRDNIKGAQTFTIAGNTVTTPNDGYRRYLVSTVVKLRNTFQIDLQKL